MHLSASSTVEAFFGYLQYRINTCHADQQSCSDAWGHVTGAVPFQGHSPIALVNRASLRAMINPSDASRGEYGIFITCESTPYTSDRCAACVVGNILGKAHCPFIGGRAGLCGCS